MLINLSIKNACGLRAFGAGLAACSAAAVVAQAQAVAVQQAQQQGSGLTAGLAALGYGGSPLGALGSPAQLQSTGTTTGPYSSPRDYNFNTCKSLFILIYYLIYDFIDSLFSTRCVLIIYFWTKYYLFLK